MALKALILVESYPSDQRPYGMSYVHTRCLEYKRRGIQFDVLNFGASTPYEFQGVRVLPDHAIAWDHYDTVMSHAPNIRNHGRILSMSKGKRVVLFFHGHECLRSSDYPRPYPWARNSLKKRMGSVYDIFKLPLLRSLLIRLNKYNDLRIIFVSGWMKRMFERNICLKIDDLCTTRVIPNSCNIEFFDNQYTFNGQANFITIRPLDESKYAIDLVTSFAASNPGLSFHLYGEGRFFDHVKRPPNLFHYPYFVTQNEIPDLLAKYRGAIMPTRFDAQGVMACEMATYGIPLITSDLEITREMLSAFPNVHFFKEHQFSEALRLDSLMPQSSSPPDTFRPQNLIGSELEFVYG